MPNKQTRVFIALAIILFFSGSYSLIYQIAWVRFLTLLLGSTTMGITTVVASFMGGLAIGSWLASKYLIDREKPLKVYALLEFIIAVTALATPLLFDWAFSSLPAILQKFGDANFSIFILRVLFSAVIMLVPTVCMGAALPVLGKYLQEYTNLAERRITIIYGLNTLGAAAGCIASGYYLLPGIGLINTIYLTAAANALLPVVILMLPKLTGGESNNADSKKAKKQNSAEVFVFRGDPLSPGARNIILVISAIVGFIGLASELVWTRLIVLTVGGSIYAYSTILAVYLFFYGVGAALGGASLKFIAVKYTEKVFEVSRTVFFALLLLIPAATTASIFIANHLPDYFIRNFNIESTANAYGLFASQLLPAIMLMSVATLLSGIFFSYGLFMMKQCTDNPAANTSYFYTWNTVGCIAGTISAAFLLIPYLGLDNTLRVTSTLLIAAGLISAYAINYKKIKAFIVTGLACSALVWFVIPGIDRVAVTAGAGINTPRIKGNPDVLKFGVGKIYEKEMEMIYYRDGFTATITTSRNRYTGELSVKTNGKGDGSSFSDMPTQKLLGHFPAFFHPDPIDVCVIGYGTGTTVGSVALHPGIKVDAIEIEPAIIEAADYLNKFNNDPLGRKNVTLHLTDGRLHLQRSMGKYDMITSEPSNPWLAGVSDLFTVEFYKLAYNALNSEGVFGQWIHMHHLKPEALKLVFRSFQEVFPDAYMLAVEPGYDLMLIGCKGSYRPSLDDIKRRIANPDIAADVAAQPVNIRSAYELFSRLIFGPAQIRSFAGEGPVNTDVLPILSYMAPLSLFDNNANIVNTQNIIRHWASNIGILGWDLDEEEMKTAKTTQEEYLRNSFLKTVLR
jgi:spermidine synthase